MRIHFCPHAPCKLACLGCPKPPAQEKSRSARPVPFIHVLQSRRGAKRFLSLRPCATHSADRFSLWPVQPPCYHPSSIVHPPARPFLFFLSHLLIRPTSLALPPLSAPISSSLASSSPIAFRHSPWTPSLSRPWLCIESHCSSSSDSPSHLPFLGLSFTSPSSLYAHTHHRPASVHPHLTLRGRILWLYLCAVHSQSLSQK